MARPLSLEEFRREISDEVSARRLLERLVWPQGPYCPRCGSFRVWRFRDEVQRDSEIGRCATREVAGGVGCREGVARP